MHRSERVADLLREEIAQIVSYELQDPRLALVTVTDVRMAANLKSAKIYVTIAGNEKITQPPWLLCVTPFLICAKSWGSR